MASEAAFVARLGSGLLVVGTLLWFVAMLRGSMACRKTKFAKAKKIRYQIERVSFLKEGRTLISGMLACNCIFNYVTRTYWTVSTLGDVANASMPELLCISWMVLSSRRRGLTRFRLNAWLCLVCLPMAIHMFVYYNPSNFMFMCVILGLASEPKIVANISSVYVFAVVFAEHDDWSVYSIMSASGFIIIFPTTVSLLCTHIFSIVALRLNGLEESGEALFALLCARYDAVVELDEGALIVNASETFFGIVGARPPANMKETSNALLRIPSVKDNPALPISYSSDHVSCLLGQSLKEMLTSEEDKQTLMSCLQEQKGLWEAQQENALDGTDETGDAQKQSSCRRHASAVHVSMRAQAATDVELRFYCAACYDAPVGRLRFFIGICRSEMPEKSPPQVPDARLVAPVDGAPMLSTTFVRFNAAVESMPVMEPVVLRGNIVSKNTPVTDLVPKAFVGRFDVFIQNMLQNAEVGERREFQHVQYKDVRGRAVADEFSVEIMRDTRATQARFTLEMLLVIKARPLERRKKGRASSNCSRSSSTLPNISESPDSVIEIDVNDEDSESVRQPHPEASDTTTVQLSL